MFPDAAQSEHESLVQISWKEFFEFGQANPGSITLLDDMREVIGIGLIMNGKSVNSRDPADLKLAEQFVLDQKPHVGAFTYEFVGHHRAATVPGAAVSEPAHADA